MLGAHSIHPSNISPISKRNKNCNFYCPSADERKLFQMGFEPGLLEHTIAEVTTKVPANIITPQLPIYQKIAPLPLTIADYQPQMPRPHLKVVPNGSQWHVAAFLEPYGPPLESCHFGSCAHTRSPRRSLSTLLAIVMRIFALPELGTVRDAVEKKCVQLLLCLCKVFPGVFHVKHLKSFQFC